MWDDLRRYDSDQHVGVDENGEPIDTRMFKSFPERPSADAFFAALGNFETRGNVVTLSASFDYSPASQGPLYVLDLKPLQFDQTCRLKRRFGSDRFFEVLIPSPTARDGPLSRIPGAENAVVDWLTKIQHYIVGRKWRAFFTRDSGYRQPKREVLLGAEPKRVHKDRVHFFAETGLGFRRPPVLKNGQKYVVPAGEPINQRTEFTATQMLDWLLQFENNQEQPHLKLFSRIHLGLTKTWPVVVFEKDQMRHLPQDILSATSEKVMNDGVGRMSPAVARHVRDVLGLSDIPSAIQGRLGSAKGMWIRDVVYTGGDLWIDTFPSQRKWVCDYEDPDHRTLEVKSWAKELKSSQLNLQLLPVLEDRAIDKRMMRRTIGARLADDLQKEFDLQNEAFSSPIQFKQWLTSNFSTRANRVSAGHVPMLAGMPQSREESLQLLIDSGFDPRKQKYIRETTLQLQIDKCGDLKSKMHIKVGQSAYVYMVVDFWGVLQEGEVHLGFSSKFQAEDQDHSLTLLTDCDVLVARSPAHFASDVQKVRAVFKNELHFLKDVIVFSSFGDVPLADKLSGGDYDGDQAWVCWDPEIVNNFENAEVPPPTDLSEYLVKDKTRFEDLVALHSNGRHDAASKWEARHSAVSAMVNKSFSFAMQPDLLGICTNYKEKLCYHRNNVGDQYAIILSTLVGNLVDAAKQGINFNWKTWDRMRADLFSQYQNLEDPLYKSESFTPGHNQEVMHIIDYLKFGVGIPAIRKHLNELQERIKWDETVAGTPGKKKTKEDEAHHYDRDLTKFHDDFASLPGSMTTRSILSSLKLAINRVKDEWDKTMARDLPYNVKISRVYNSWRSINLQSLHCKVDPKVQLLLEQKWMADPEENSNFSLLKASMAFKLYYKHGARFVFAMCGRQMGFLKALTTKGVTSGGSLDGHLMLVTPLMYAGMASDQKFVKQYLARMDCSGTQFVNEDPEMGEVVEVDANGWSHY